MPAPQGEGACSISQLWDFLAFRQPALEALAAPIHHHVVVPGEHRARERGEEAHPGLGDIDDPVVAHLRAGARRRQRPAAGAGKLAVGAALDQRPVSRPAACAC